MNLAPPIPRFGRPPADPEARDRKQTSETRRTANRTPTKDLTNALQRERHAPDYMILVVVVALAAIGILMVYSSSAMKGYLSADADTFQTVGPQIQWALLGLVAMVAMMRVDYRYLRLVSIRATSSPSACSSSSSPTSTTSSASARWLGSATAGHPAEMAKLALVVYLAHWFAKRGTRVGGSGGHRAVPADRRAGDAWCLGRIRHHDGHYADRVHHVVRGRGQIPPARYRPGRARRDRGCPGATRWTASGRGSTMGLRVDHRTTVRPARSRARRGPGVGLGEPVGGLFVPNAFNDFIFAIVGGSSGWSAWVVIALFVPSSRWHPRRARRAGHVRGAPGRRHHRLAVHPGIHQHRGRGDPRADHRHHAAVHQRRWLVAHHQLRRDRDPALDLARDHRERDLERRCDC